MKSGNKIALIPGASRPIGRAIAKKFAENKISLALPCFNDWPESITEMKEEFTSLGCDFLCIPCDLTSSSETASFLKQVKSHFGNLNFLINNIERGGMPVVHGAYTKKVNHEQWKLEFDTTLKAKWNLFNYSLPLMKRSGSGSITNISSIAGKTGRTGAVSPLFNDGYSAANRGIQVLTETWSRQASPEIRVNEIMLGLIRGRHGEGTRGWSLLSKQQQHELTEHTLLKRTGCPEEVAEFVYFISTQAEYLTGSTIRFDGGFLLGGQDTPAIPEGVL